MTATTGRKAILVVSFGTSFAETRAKTIDRIEEDIAGAFPDCRIYRAWTSKVIIAKLMRRDNIQIPTVKDAVSQMLSDGITHVVVQPTHLLGGIENQQMKEEIESSRASFSSLSFGAPLLAATADCRQTIRAAMKELPRLKEDEALVFMGHGTSHEANAVYPVLDRMLKDEGYPRAFLGTVEGCPTFDTLLKRVSLLCPKKIYLVPFMVVAGDHALHDMSGEDEASWQSRFRAAGFQTECILKGLGEYPAVRRLYIEHARQAS